MIPQSVLEQIQSASDLAEVISSYIPLKRAGRSFKACCPFHHEKTPSFFVSPEKGIWHCFGCGAGGSVFNFVMLYERINFPDAVRQLARKAGIEVPEVSEKSDADGERKEDLYRANEFAATWFAARLGATPMGKRVINYLARRGISDALIAEFGLGYAPDSRDALIKAARAKGHRLEAILAAGLAMPRDGGKAPIDRFRHRLMIPIHDVSGRVIAFSGRVLGEGSPKYMNSPESPLFSKSRSLYGLHHSKRAIADAGFAIVVEGYFDYLSLYAAGVRNVAASQGTAFTPDHARILKRYTREGEHEVVMSFDGDEAGLTAAMRSVDAFLHEGLRVRVLALPNGFDPDTLVKKKGVAAFNALLEKAPEYFDFLLQQLCRQHDLKSEVGKARIAHLFLEQLAKVRNEVLRDAYRKKLAEHLDIPQEHLIRELQKVGRADSAPRAAGAVSEPRRLPPGEKEIIRLMLEDERIIELVAEELRPEDFRDEQLQRIAACTFELFRERRWAGCGRLLAVLNDERCASVVSGIVSEELPGGDRAQIARDCIRFLKRRSLKDEIGSIARDISRREREGNAETDTHDLQHLIMQKKADLLKIS